MFNEGIAVAKANFTVNLIQPPNTDRWSRTPDARLRLKVSEADDERLLGANASVHSGA